VAAQEPRRTGRGGGQEPQGQPDHQQTWALATSPIGEALHTYFQIGDIADIKVLGLDGCEYVDKVGGTHRRTQSGAVTFAGEVDRVYVNSEATCVIEDSRLKRRIIVAKSGSRSTVVWTPWTEKADKMGDFGPTAGAAWCAWNPATPSTTSSWCRPGRATA